jgi:DNA repair exonuclease SbcCD ATPase subunit
MLESVQRKYYQLTGRLSQLEQTQKELSRQIKAREVRLESLEKVQALIQTTAQETQEKLRYHIEDLVQTALESCFPGEYDFFVKFEIKRGKTEARMYLEKDREEIPPMDGTGGGVVDIVSLALRLVSWTFSGTSHVLILDEPMKWLSVDLRPIAGEMLRELSKKLGIQIILVTHDPEIINVSDKVFKVSQSKGKSKVITHE